MAKEEEKLSVEDLIEKIETIPERIRPRDRAILEMVSERLGELAAENHEQSERIDSIGKSPTELVVVYPHGLKFGRPGAPLPRFQFRWAVDPNRSYSWLCYYEFCWQLQDLDIRNEWGHGEARAILGCTRVGTEEPPYERGLAHATPYRDGAHAKWDAAAFGNPPTYVVSPDGKFALRADPASPTPQQDGAK